MARIHYQKYRGITLLGRELRKNQTLSEKKLWFELRGRKISGYKFIRQHPVFYRIDKGWIDFYIADFYCSELKLIIELDGLIHESSVDNDSERDSKLNEKGITVVRIRNSELEEMVIVLNKIKKVLAERSLYITDIK